MGAPVSDGGAPVVALRGLSKTFGGAQALNDVDLTINPGEVHGLLGENGSGKSTLIKVLERLPRPDDGASWRSAARPVALPLAPGSSASSGSALRPPGPGAAADLTVAREPARDAS